MLEFSKASSSNYRAIYEGRRLFGCSLTVFIGCMVDEPY